MNFKNINEFYEKFYPYSDLPKDCKIIDYWLNYKKKPKFGEWILFQRISEKGIQRPILALCVGHTVYDQSLVLEYVEDWRAFHWNSTITTNKGFEFRVADDDRKVQNVIFWHDDIHVLGHWKTKPNFSELRKSYKNKI